MVKADQIWACQGELTLAQRGSNLAGRSLAWILSGLTLMLG